ncbi:MAG: hypothetical protein N2V75_08605 [Methanophagales archaeon]|nr:hypothetical protein [Methanophagales archaeon]
MNENRSKMVLMSIAIVAIGIFTLPISVSLFSAQHTWYDLSAGANDVPCEKCHAEIADEMQSSDNGVHRDLTCAMCHRTIFTNYIYGSGYGSGSAAGKEAHAASTVECMDCHGIWHDWGVVWDHYSYSEYVGECYKCHGGYGGIPDRGYLDFISAGGFGIEDPMNPGHNTTDTDTGAKAAHKKFVLDAMNETLMEGANEACIACHTRVGVNITWRKNENLEFNATEDGTGNWTIPSFAAGGENVTQVNTPNNWTI